MLSRPGSGGRFADWPHLTIRVPAMKPHNDAMSCGVEKYLRRGHVGVEVLKVFRRVGLRPEECGIAYLQHAWLVDVPWTLNGVGVSETYVLAHVMSKVHVVTTEGMLHPVGYANYRRPVDVISECGRR